VAFDRKTPKTSVIVKPNQNFVFLPKEITFARIFPKVKVLQQYDLQLSVQIL
jgi:hypothetical protein